MKRLKKHADSLINRQYDIEEIYNNIELEVDNIKDELNTLKDIIDDLNIQDIVNQVSDAKYIVDNIIASCEVIYNYASEAKSIGQYNEDMLVEGKNIISRLEKDIEELKQEIEDMISGNEQLEYEISELENQISEIENILSELQQNDGIEASKKEKRLIRIEASYAWICNVHDEMMFKAERIVSLINIKKSLDKLLTVEYENKLQVMIEKFQNSIDNKYNEIMGILDDYINDMHIGLDMNNRMGAGINRKNSLIVELQEELSQLEEELNDISYNYHNLQDIKEKLEEDLRNLNSLLP